MKYVRSALLLASLSLSLALGSLGCLAGDDSRDLSDITDSDLAAAAEATHGFPPGGEVVIINPRPQIGIDVEAPAGNFDPQPAPTPHVPEACLCTTEQCIRDWIDSHIGCDVCAVIVCPGDDVSACNACPDAI